ncbi:N-acetylglucosamine-6-phosphate deacetylase [Rosistilla ulvae]|uniref:N-acetylglucosamine-6-phosphate deacetylase n=1 Tax=Rosistilla ulvae TaxID=1930277 RepID=A0A517M3T4_9BACT|nr:amidohydrolase family protein [Rosistilla ulvae]QDS89519.1 N-acetylglucosamine-6-phosphate deacetylase [Rosistilla ulvae]
MSKQYQNLFGWLVPAVAKRSEPSGSATARTPKPDRRSFVIRSMLATCFGCALVAGTNVDANDQIPGAAQSTPIALVGGVVHTIDAKTLNNATVVFEKGKITKIGKHVVLPAKCRSIDVAGKHIYPGLMESMSNVGLTEIGSVRATVDTDEVGDENPNLRPWVAVNADSELIPVARAGGVLLASIAPKRGNIRGQSAVIQLDGWTYKDMLLRGDTGMIVSWRSYDSRKSSSIDRAKERDERLKGLSDRLETAARYAIARAARPDWTPVDLRFEALIPVLEGESPMIVDADDRREIEAAVAFCVARGIRPIIYGGYDAPECAPLLKKYDVPVIVHSTYRLPLRRDDPYDHPYTLPSRLSEAGIRFAIGGPGAGSPGGGAAARNLPYHAAVAVAYGLPADEAIRAITLAPAEIMGVADRVGSITVGKDATLIVVDGDILQSESNVTDAYIAGAKVDLGSKHRTLADKYRTKYKQRSR